MLDKFISIDEHGDIFLDPDQPALKDPNQIEEVQLNLKLTDKFALTTEFQGELYFVESFDHPLKIKALEFKNDKIILQTKENNLFEAIPDKWSVDEWDRFHGLTATQAPFVLTKSAQEQLFNIADSFDDEGFVAREKYIATPPYFLDSPGIHQADYWSDIYKTEGNPGWNLNQPAEAFKDMFPRLKLPKSRILVLGCGEGHDAAFFAQAGHVVTAVDFSKEAIERGKVKYGNIDSLSFYQEDVFQLPQEWNHTFDLVVEHACFCAVPPEKRDELIRVWRRMLHEEGQLMALFFTMEKRSGPPYGSTEWEIRKRLQNYFQFLFWGRWRTSSPQRQGRELFVLAKKI